MKTIKTNFIPFILSMACHGITWKIWRPRTRDSNVTCVNHFWNEFFKNGVRIRVKGAPLPMKKNCWDQGCSKIGPKLFRSIIFPSLPACSYWSNWSILVHKIQCMLSSPSMNFILWLLQFWLQISFLKISLSFI